jgi:hypothetical protein
MEQAANRPSGLKKAHGYPQEFAESFPSRAPEWMKQTLDFVGGAVSRSRQ